MEVNEALKKFVIMTRSEGLKWVSGTKLNSEYFAHNEGPYSKWHISDIASGLSLVSGLPTLFSCREYIKNISEDLILKVEAIRQSERYKEQCEKVDEFKKLAVENFNTTYSSLENLYLEDTNLTEKTNKKGKGQENTSNKVKSWRDYFLVFEDVGIKPASGIFKPLISPEFAGSYDSFLETFGSFDTAKLIEKINYIIRTFEINGRSRPGDSEKVNGVDHPIWELKIGETSSHKPIRSLYFIKTDSDGTKYVIFASLFIHTEKNLTATERNSGRNAYFAANPKN